MTGDDVSAARRRSAAQGLNVCRAGFAGRGTTCTRSTDATRSPTVPIRDKGLGSLESLRGWRTWGYRRALMSETGSLARGLAGDCMVESAEGPVAMRDTPNKGFAVLTRLPSGQLGFRQLIKVVESGPVPLVRVVLDSGHTAVVARDHVFYRVGLEPVPAARLRPGDQLETAFRYPGDYAPPDATTPVRQTIAVRAIEPAGEGQVWAGTVRDTHALFLTAGVLCAE